MKALVLLADGSEEMEAVIACDILCRGGIQVVRAAVGAEKAVKCANGMVLVADVLLEELNNDYSHFTVLVLPGGSKGSITFSKVRK